MVLDDLPAVVESTIHIGCNYNGNDRIVISNLLGDNMYCQVVCNGFADDAIPDVSRLGIFQNMLPAANYSFVTRNYA